MRANRPRTNLARWRAQERDYRKRLVACYATERTSTNARDIADAQEEARFILEDLLTPLVVRIAEHLARRGAPRGRRA